MATCTRSNTKLQQRTTRSLTGIRLLSVRIRTSVVYTTSLYSFHYSIQSLMITLSSCTVSNLTTVTAAVLQLFLDLDLFFNFCLKIKACTNVNTQTHTTKCYNTEVTCTCCGCTVAGGAWWYDERSGTPSSPRYKHLIMLALMRSNYAIRIAHGEFTY